MDQVVLFTPTSRRLIWLSLGILQLLLSAGGLYAFQAVTAWDVKLLLALGSFFCGLYGVMMVSVATLGLFFPKPVLIMTADTIESPLLRRGPVYLHDIVNVRIHKQLALNPANYIQVISLRWLVVDVDERVLARKSQHQRQKNPYLRIPESLLPISVEVLKQKIETAWKHP